MILNFYYNIKKIEKLENQLKCVLEEFERLSKNIQTTKHKERSKKASKITDSNENDLIEKLEIQETENKRLNLLLNASIKDNETISKKFKDLNLKSSSFDILANKKIEKLLSVIVLIKIENERLLNKENTFNEKSLDLQQEEKASLKCFKNSEEKYASNEFRDNLNSENYSFEDSHMHTYYN